MDACKRRRENVKGYNLESLETFFALEPGQTLHDGEVFDNEMIIYHGETEVASIWLEVTEEDVYIHLLQRSSKALEHKGIVRKILYLIICKAIELGLPITFRAVPETTTSARVYGSGERGNLYSYYEKIGFTPANLTKVNHKRSSINYKTSVKTLKNIVGRWAEADAEADTKADAEAEADAEAGAKGGGRRKTRRHKRRNPL